MWLTGSAFTLQLIHDLIKVYLCGWQVVPLSLQLINDLNEVLPVWLTGSACHPTADHSR